jgi:hypothetical protein
MVGLEPVLLRMYLEKTLYATCVEEFIQATVSSCI